MRITRNQLRQIIQEELKLVRSPREKRGKLDWDSLKGTPIGDATLDPSLRSQFKIKDWSAYERAARDANETIKGED